MRILAVGVATLDLINQVPSYPAEDSEQRATAQWRRRGGNATNSLVVLAQLGHQCHWGGVVADDPDSAFVLQDLESFAINTQYCVQHQGGRLPTSYVTLSAHNGSRTIVHYRALPEYPLDAFMSIDLAQFDWVHFEGRDVANVARMLAHVISVQSPGCSLEVEKSRPGIEALFRAPDLLLFSRQYAGEKGFRSAPQLLAEAVPDAQAATCTWGVDGAWGVDRSGALFHSPADRAEKSVDTLGAGDVFNAAMIDSWSANRGMSDCLCAATSLAARKCRQVGFAGLRLPGQGV